MNILPFLLLFTTCLLAACNPSMEVAPMEWENIPIPGDIQKVEKKGGVRHVTDLWGISCQGDGVDMLPTLPNHVVHYRQNAAVVEKIEGAGDHFVTSAVTDFQDTRIYGGNGRFAYKESGKWISKGVKTNPGDKYGREYAGTYINFLGFTAFQNHLYAALHVEDEIFEWVNDEFRLIPLNLPPHFKRKRQQKFIIKAIASHDDSVFVAGVYNLSNGHENVLLKASTKRPLTAETQWEQIPIPGHGGITGMAVDPKDGTVWIVGYSADLFSKSGLAVEYKDGKMISHKRALPYALQGVDVTSQGQVLVAGEKGFIGLWNGKEWRQVAFPEQKQLYGICVEPDQTAYVVGAEGLAYKTRTPLAP